MNFQVTVLKILVSYPDGFAVMEDIKRDMVILATSGRDWADRTRRLAARVPDLDIFSQGLVDRESGGWKITAKGRAVLEFMESRPTVPEPVPARLVEEVAEAVVLPAAVPPLRQPAIVPSGVAKSANVVARHVNGLGRTSPEMKLPSAGPGGLDSSRTGITSQPQAREADTTAHIDDWVNSSGLQSPK